MIADVREQRWIFLGLAWPALATFGLALPVLSATLEGVIGVLWLGLVLTATVYAIFLFVAPGTLSTSKKTRLTAAWVDLAPALHAVWWLATLEVT